MPGELGALLLGDARLPAGGHTNSAGLEPALIAGMPASAVADYIDARLRTVGLVEASAAVLAHRAAAAADADRLSAVQEALLARTPSAPQREVSARLGRGLARLGGRLWPDHPAVAALRSLGSAPQRPVAFGTVAAVAGLDEAQTARVSLYEDAQTVASAALKLAPVDPVDAAGWVLAAEQRIDDLVGEALAVDAAASMPAKTAPQIEVWSLDHHRRNRRLFVA